MIVAAAAGVQFAGYGADQFGQAALVGGVNVLVARFDFELFSAPLAGNLFETGDDLFGFVRGKQSGSGQSLGVGLAAADIGLPEAPIERDRRVELFHQGIERVAEAPSP